MTNIHLIGGEKGGVGKSLVSRIVAQYLIDKNVPFLGFDTDRSHGALMRFYSGLRLAGAGRRLREPRQGHRGGGRPARPAASSSTWRRRRTTRW
jgi:cellulose biosynthesis protein BcsQ